jgi:hypothetical protein
MAGISFLQLLKNSWAIDLLLLFSVLALAVILERLWAYSKLGINEKALLEKVQAAIKKGNIQEASFICKSVNHPLGEILDVGIKNMGLPREDIDDLLNSTLIETKTHRSASRSLRNRDGYHQSFPRSFRIRFRRSIGRYGRCSRSAGIYSYRNCRSYTRCHILQLLYE